MDFKSRGFNEGIGLDLFKNSVVVNLLRKGIVVVFGLGFWVE